MQVFFHTNIQPDATLELAVEESHHIAKVLRMKPQQRLIITNGNGEWVEGELFDTQRNKVYVKTDLTVQTQRLQQPQLHLYVAPTKNMDRNEWMLEKCTELGMASFTFINTKRTERKHINTERCQKIIVAAAKQSRQFHFPHFSGLVDIKEVLNQNIDGPKAIAYCGIDTEKNAIQNLIPTEGALHVMIGPEGDFTTEEVQWALNARFEPVQLGESRLRTETAAMYAASLLREGN